MKWKLLSHVWLFATPWTMGILQARILECIAFPFSRGSSSTQGLNRGLPHCRWILYQLSHKGSPRILYWVAYPFSSGFSWHRNRTRVSCIAGRFFTNWNIREALKWDSVLYNECLSVISNIIHISNWVLEPHSKKQLIFSIFRISLSQAAFQGRNKHWLVPVPSNYYNGI